MKLADLPLDNARFEPRFAALDVAGIAADSRKVKSGFLFFAIAGAKADGAHFAKQAVAAGAVAVAAEQRPDGLPDNVAFVQVANARRALALAAAGFFPRQPGNNRRRHRHQRQDLGRRLHAADLDLARPPSRQHRHHRRGLARRAKHTAR